MSTWCSLLQMHTTGYSASSSNRVCTSKIRPIILPCPSVPINTSLERHSGSITYGTVEHKLNWVSEVLLTSIRFAMTWTFVNFPCLEQRQACGSRYEIPWASPTSIAIEYHQQSWSISNRAWRLLAQMMLVYVAQLALEATKEALFAGSYVQSYKSRSAPKRCPHWDEPENHLEPENGRDIESVRLLVKILLPNSWIIGMKRGGFLIKPFENCNGSLTYWFRGFII